MCDIPTFIDEAVAAYERAPAVLELEGIDDRAVDLWSPLLALATVADAEDRGRRLREVLAAGSGCTACACSQWP